MSNIKKDTGQVSVPLLLGDLLSHDAKIASNNLAWKVIEFYAKTIKIAFLGKIYTNISWRFKINI